MKSWQILGRELPHNFTFYTYKVKYDMGCAPNPHHKICTLAICKPKIRATAKPGDVIVGLGCKSNNDNETRVIYCMIVEDVISWSEYIDRCKKNEYPERIPTTDTDYGDCIWENADKYQPVRSSWSGHDGEDFFHRDVISGKYVLISKLFWYFGKNNSSGENVYLPDSLYEVVPGRGHRSISNKEYRNNLLNEFFPKLPETPGCYGVPAITPEITKRTCTRTKCSNNHRGNVVRRNNQRTSCHMS